jgi:hypothetical protein
MAASESGCEAIVTNLYRTLKRLEHRGPMFPECGSLARQPNDPDHLQFVYAEICEAWQGSEKRRRHNLLKIMQRVGLTESSKAISAPLPETYLKDLISLKKDDFTARFKIYPAEGN